MSITKIKGFITQDGNVDSAPTLKIIENTVDNDLSTTYRDSGSVNIQSPNGNFKAIAVEGNKVVEGTYTEITRNQPDVPDLQIAIQYVDNYNVRVDAIIGGTYTNGMLNDTPFEITVYSV